MATPSETSTPLQSPQTPSAEFSSTPRSPVKPFNEGHIKVMVRFKPDGEYEHTETAITMGETFTFDRMFAADTTQDCVYVAAVQPVVEDVIGGYNGTVLCYGQTGSGKSYTMFGSDNNDGCVQRLCRDIIDKAGAKTRTCVSFMEIYMEQVFDCLNAKSEKLAIQQDKAGIYVKGLSRVLVENEEQMLEIVERGFKQRNVASTLMNMESSRSHAIVQIHLEQQLAPGICRKSTLSLVDLAGSEKLSKTQASGLTFDEAKKINSSLSCLGNVISALTTNKTHVPYRDSKLTRILQDSLGGNSRTTLIMNCSSSASNESETLSTLRFGMRAKKIRNKARVNTVASSSDVDLQYIATLEKELRMWRRSGWVDSSHWSSIRGDSEQAAPIPNPYEELERLKTQVSRSGSPYLPSGAGSGFIYSRVDGKVDDRLGDTAMAELEDRCRRVAELELENDRCQDVMNQMHRLNMQLKKNVQENEAAMHDLLARYTESQMELGEKQNETDFLHKEIMSLQRQLQKRNSDLSTESPRHHRAGFKIDIFKRGGE